MPISHLTIILHLGLPLKSLFYLLITAHHNSNFFKVIKKFRSKIKNQKKKKISWNNLGFFHKYLNIPINFLRITLDSFHHIQWKLPPSNHPVIPLFFFHTFDGSIVTLGSNNILFDRTFLIFGGTLIFTNT